MPRGVTHEHASSGAPPAPPSLDARDRQLLDQLQADFPIKARPWGEFGLPEEEALRRVRALRAQGLIRQISPIFDSRALGYASELVAAKVDESRIESAAAVINQHPGVSHNYQREAHYNLWFTLATPPGQDIAAHLDRLKSRAQLDVVRPMPAMRTYKIGVRLPMSEEDPPAAAGGPRTERAVPLTERDKAIIRATQDDLPCEIEPFAPALEAMGMRIEELAQWLARMRSAGALRRFAAILRHRHAGFSANAMVAWRVAANVVDQAGQLAAQVAQVSHCYHRPSYEDWPYRLYTMIHGRTREEVRAVVTRLAQALRPLGVTEHHVAYSGREFKKQRVRYFV